MGRDDVLLAKLDIEVGTISAQHEVPNMTRKLNMLLDCKPRKLCAIAIASLLVSSASCAAAPLHADSQHTAFTERVNSYFDQLAADGVSGVVHISLRNETLISRGFGFSDCKKQTPAHPGDVFLIGSITKIFVELLAYQLEAKGQLGFEDEVGEYIPDLPAHLASLRIEDLITHRSGLPDLIDKNGKAVETYTVEYDYENIDQPALIERFVKTNLIFKPGEREEYSNLGYQILTVILEKAADKAFEKLAHEHIFEPAGMSHTGYILPDWTGVKFADGCRVGGDRWGTPYKDGMWLDDGPSWTLRGAGGMLGTVEDLSLFLGALHNGKLLQPTVQSRYAKATFGQSKKYGERVSSAAGSNDIFNAFYYWLIDSDVRLIVITSNADQQGEKYIKEMVSIAASSRELKPQIE